MRGAGCKHCGTAGERLRLHLKEGLPVELKGRDPLSAYVSIGRGVAHAKVSVAWEEGAKAKISHRVAHLDA